VSFSTRIATAADIPAIAVLMDRAIDALQRDYLTPEQIAASRLSMGLDTQLIADGTYVWSRTMPAASSGAAGGAGDRRSMAAMPARLRATPRRSTRQRTRRESARCTPTPISPGAGSGGWCSPQTKRRRERRGSSAPN
jgi:hypothetical protein